MFPCSEHLYWMKELVCLPAHCVYSLPRQGSELRLVPCFLHTLGPLHWRADDLLLPTVNQFPWCWSVITATSSLSLPIPSMASPPSCKKHHRRSLALNGATKWKRFSVDTRISCNMKCHWLSQVSCWTKFYTSNSLWARLRVWEPSSYICLLTLVWARLYLASAAHDWKPSLINCNNRRGGV